MPTKVLNVSFFSISHLRATFPNLPVFVEEEVISRSIAQGINFCFNASEFKLCKANSHMQTRRCAGRRTVTASQKGCVLFFDWNCCSKVAWFFCGLFNCAVCVV